VSLPGPCDRCEPYEGNFALDANGGFRRCECPRGRALRSYAVRPPSMNVKPVISNEEAIICTEMLATIPFFPGESGARLAVADEFRSICNSSEEAFWLVTRLIRLYRRWPGVLEMRLVFCSRYQPLDGVEAAGTSEVYPDGIPSERLVPQSTQLVAGRPRKEIRDARAIEATVPDLLKVRDLS
jgi:hypothetical protein